MKTTYRFPKPSEYGTAQAVQVKACNTCGFSYRTLTRPIFITTTSGELILTYKVGQLICDWCLRRNCKQSGLEIHLS